MSAEQYEPFNMDMTQEFPAITPIAEAEENLRDAHSRWGRETQNGTINLSSPAAQFANEEAQHYGSELSKLRVAKERADRQALKEQGAGSFISKLMQTLRIPR